MKNHTKKKRVIPHLRGSSYKGCLRFSQELICTVLGINPRKVLYIEASNDPAEMRVYHRDESAGTVWELAEGQCCPTERPKINNIAKGMAALLERSGWKVEPPDEMASPSSNSKKAS